MDVAAPPRTAVVSEPHYAGFWIRVLAFMVDALVIGLVVGVVTLGRAGIATYGGWWEPVVWRAVPETVVSFAYFTLAWSAIGGGQTLGMRLLGLRVVDAEGRAIGYGAAVLRWVGIVISAGAVLIGLAWVAFDARKQGWHDMLARTVVVRAGTGAGPAIRSAGMAPSVPHPLARALAVGLGLTGGALGLTGTALAIMGDAVVGPGMSLNVAGTMAVLGVAGAVLAWGRPSIALAAFAAAVAGDWLALAPALGPWYEGLLAATAAGPVAETQYWSDAPAMAFMVASGFLLAAGCLAALLGIGRRGEAEA